MSKEIRILIADDHPIFREGLKKVIERDSLLRITGEAEDGEKAIERIKDGRPDVAGLDMNVPVQDGFAVVRALQETKLPMEDELGTFNQP